MKIPQTDRFVGNLWEIWCTKYRVVHLTLFYQNVFLDTPQKFHAFVGENVFLWEFKICFVSPFPQNSFFVLKFSFTASFLTVFIPFFIVCGMSLCAFVEISPQTEFSKTRVLVFSKDSKKRFPDPIKAKTAVFTYIRGLCHLAEEFVTNKETHKNSE